MTTWCPGPSSLCSSPSGSRYDPGRGEEGEEGSTLSLERSRSSSGLLMVAKGTEAWSTSNGDNFSV